MTLSRTGNAGGVRQPSVPPPPRCGGGIEISQPPPPATRTKRPRRDGTPAPSPGRPARPKPSQPVELKRGGPVGEVPAEPLPFPPQTPPRVGARLGPARPIMDVLGQPTPLIAAVEAADPALTTALTVETLRDELSGPPLRSPIWASYPQPRPTPAGPKMEDQPGRSSSPAPRARPS